ncbi:MAG: hypothetical protein QM831_08520 [Kofleriaceae bacterium]
MLDRWRTRTAWSKRSAEFADLGLHGNEPAVRLTQSGPRFDRLYECWSRLAGQRAFLTPIGDSWFRYPALDWEHVVTDPASLGVELVRAYQQLMALMPADVLGWFTTPIIKFDLDGELRLAFSLDGEVSPEVRDKWPRCDELGLIYAIGTALAGYESLQPIVERCRASGFANMRDLLEAFVDAGGKRRPPHGTRPARKTWEYVDRGLGWLELDGLTQALNEFVFAGERDLDERTSGTHRDAATARTRSIRNCIFLLREDVRIATTTPWSDAEQRGRQLEAERRFAEAKKLYLSVRDPENAGLALVAGRARCAIGLHDHRNAIILARESGQPALIAEAAFRVQQFDEALAAVEQLPVDETTLLLRGKCLLGLGRMTEARDVFLRTPGIVALMLRREVDRKMGITRDETGIANAQTSPVSDEVRDLVLADKLDEAIAILERSGDRLILGELYLRTNRPADALVTFEALDTIEALDGKSRALRALGRISDADAAHELYEQHAARKSDLRAR